MKAEIFDRMNHLKDIWKNVSGDDAAGAEKAAGEKLDADNAAADEARAAGFANNSKKKPDAAIVPANPDEFTPDLEGKGHIGSGVYDRGSHIHVVGPITKKKAAIIAALAEEKGWTTLAVYNPDHSSMNKQATGKLMQMGIPCVSDPKALPAMHKLLPAVEEFMAQHQHQRHMLSKAAAPGPAPTTGL